MCGEGDTAYLWNMRVSACMKRFLLNGSLLAWLAFVIVPHTLHAQGAFFKTYGKVPQDYGYSLRRTFDGGYILGGISNGYGGSNYLFLVRTDANGDTLWMRGYVTVNTTFGFSLVQCADSGFAVCGNSGYARIDKQGAMLWQTICTGTSFYSIRATTDNGFILAGSFGQSSTSNGMDVYLLKVDSNGVKQWSRKYGGAGDEYATCIQATPDGGYILAGSTNTYGAGGWDMYVIKTNVMGDTLWTRTYGGTLSEGGVNSTRQTIEPTFDGGYILGSYSASFFTAGGNDAYLVKTDAAGNVMWSRMYGGFASEIIYDVKQCADSGFVFAGSTTSFGGGSSDIYLVRTNSTGDTLFTRCFGGLLNDIAQSVVETPDKGFAICGYTNNWGSGNNDALLLKVDSLGNSSCHQNSTGTTVTAPATITKSTSTGKIFLTLNVNTNNPVTKSGGGVTDACSVNGLADFAKTRVTVHPNPSSGLFRLTAQQDGEYQVRICDLLGKPVLNRPYTVTQQETTLDLQHLPEGSYFLELNAHPQRSFIKLLIIK